MALENILHPSLSQFPNSEFPAVGGVFLMARLLRSHWQLCISLCPSM
jgi:hypothetical protein